MYLTRNKSKSPYWQIVFEVEGKLTSRSTRKRKSDAAERFFKNFKKQYEAGLIKKIVRLGEFKNEYIEYVALSGKDSYIRSSIKPAFRSLERFAGKIDMKKIDDRLLEKYLLTTFRNSKYSAVLYFKTLRAAFNKALKWKLIDSPLLVGFRLPKIQPPEPLFITLSELKKIIGIADRQIYKDIFMFAFLTGLRASEILNLTWESVSLANGVIQIGSDKFTTKARRLRYIPISKPVRYILERRKPKIIRQSGNYVFGKSSGFPYSVSFISKAFKKCVRRARLNEKIHFHTLRASFGSYLLQQGESISVISKLLGHSSIAVTERHYASLSLNDLKDAVRCLDRLSIK